MLTEGARVREALEAAVALERPLTRVQPQVLRQVVLVLERLLTLGAGIRPLIFEKKKKKNGV